MINYKTEILAGVVTFSTMSYIICVQPALMSGQLLGTPTGMDSGALITTTCLISALSCFLMGLWAKYPLALAPGMGENFLVVQSMFPACALILGVSAGDESVWRLALGAVFLSGLLFALLSLFQVRSAMVQIISPSLKSAIAAGIGLFIAYLGLKSGGVIQISHDTLGLGRLLSPEAGIFLTGLLVGGALIYWKAPGALLWGIIASAIVAMYLNKIEFNGFFGAPANPMPVVGKLDIIGALKHLSQLWPMIIILTFMDVFDTFGTAIGVAKQAKLLVKDESGNEVLPRCERVFATDAAATMGGAFFGHSTVTCFAESASGVESGGRTGFTAIVVGALFLFAPLFTPFFATIGQCPAITASALVIVGIMMMRNVKDINWDDYTEAIPAFMILAGIAFSNSIADGILLGLVIYPVLKALCGRFKDVHCGLWILSALLIAYLFVR